MTGGSADVLVVGGGMAAYRAARTVAGGGSGRTVTIIGAEPEPPYDRPKLTKEFLQGRAEAADVLFASADSLREQGIEAIGGATVTGLHPQRNEVTLEDGRQWAFNDLIAATGCRPRPLSLFPAGAGNVFHVHSLGEARRLRAAMNRLGPDGRLVIVGGGFIGTEVAYAAWLRRFSVTIIERAGAPLSAALGDESASRIGTVYQDAGVQLILNDEIAGVKSDGTSVRQVTTAGGEVLDCDIVVVGIGTLPNTEWLEGSGVDLSDGAVTDAAGATSRPHVYSVGDVARWDRPHYGHIRIEHETDAQNQAVVVGRTILGRRARLAGLPYVWSDQFGLEIRYFGHCPRPGQSTLIERGRESFATVYASDGVACAVATVNWPEAAAPAKQLLGARETFDAERAAATFSNL